MATDGIQRIESAFAKNAGMKLMTHIVGGYPSLDESEKIVRAMSEAGADLIEIQIPFSDPTADGPVIVGANVAARENGVTTRQVLEMSGRLARELDTPILTMTYINPVFAYGVEKFINDIASLGISGVIIPDCPPEEDLGAIAAANKAKIAFVPLVAPSTDDERMKYLGSVSLSPFVYAVMRLGVTGKKTEIGNDTASYCAKVGNLTGKKVAAGFGIRERSQVIELEGKADCAIVGSAVTEAVRLAEEAGKDAAAAAGEMVRKLKG